MSTDQEVTVEFNEQVFRLCFTNKSIHLAENMLGKSMMEVFTSLSTGITVNEIATLLWAALRKNHKPAFDSPGKLMDATQPKDLISNKLMESLMDAYKQATNFGDDESETTKDPLA